MEDGGEIGETGALSLLIGRVTGGGDLGGTGGGASRDILLAPFRDLAVELAPSRNQASVTLSRPRDPEGTSKVK
jgi:hypothetical protein